MFRRCLTSSVAAGAVMALYLLYHWTVTPVVAPPGVLQRRSQTLSVRTQLRLERPHENVRRAEQYLREIPWAAQARCMLRHENIFVYCQEWTPERATGTVTLRPFVLLLVERSGAPDERPLIVRAEAASVRFARGFDFENPDPGPPTAAQLVGDVRITGPDGLRLHGRNFAYSLRALRVWSDHAVTFRYQQHSGTAEGVQIDLIPSDRPGDDLAVVGIRNVQLRRNVQMQLHHDDRETVGPVRVQCRNGAVFDLDRYRIVFSGSVSVERPTEKGPDAIRDADTLLLQLAAAGAGVPGIPVGQTTPVGGPAVAAVPVDRRPPEPTGRHVGRAGTFFSLPETAPPATEGRSRAAASVPPARRGPFRLDVPRRPHEFHRDRSKPAAPPPFFPDELVELLASSGESSGKATAPDRDRNEFVLPSTKLVFQRLEASGGAVSVESVGSTLTALASQIVYDAVGRLVRLEGVETQTAGWSGRLVKLTHRSGELYGRSARFGLDASHHVQTVWCEGPGWLDHRAAPRGGHALHLEWTQHLQKDIRSDGGEVVEVVGKALVEVPGQRAGVIADTIRVYFRQRSGTREIEKLQLEKIVAEGAVAVAHTRLEARTDRLQIDFEPADARAAADDRAAPGTSAAAPWDSQLDDPRAGTARSPLRVDATTVVLRVRQAINGRWRLERVLTEGAVYVAYGVPGTDHTAVDPVNAHAARSGMQAAAAVRASDSGVAFGLVDASGSIVRDGSARDTAFGLENTTVPAAAPDGTAFEILGERLSIEHASEPDAQVLVISGAPAIVRTAEARLSGPSIVFDRGRAEAHVHGPGRLELRATELDLASVIGNAAPTDARSSETPDAATARRSKPQPPSGSPPAGQPHAARIAESPAVLAEHATASADAASERPPGDGSDEWLIIRWSEEMRFDGQQAEFFGEVRAAYQTFHLRCQEMAVTLDRPLKVFQAGADHRSASAKAAEFAPPAAAGTRSAEHRVNATADQAPPRPQIEQVVCREAVAFDAFQYRDGVLAGVRKVQCGRFEFRRSSGAFVVRGPGRILNWSRDDDQPRPVIGSVRVQANQPLRADQPEWQFVRIDFAGEARGNARERFTTFLDRVRIIHGAVADPQTELDPEHLPETGIEMTADALDALLPQQGQKALQLLARGNVKLAGRSFFARADTVSYDDARGLFVLTARGDQPAAIWRQKAFGGEFSRAEARRMEFNPSRNELRMYGIVGAQGQP